MPLKQFGSYFVMNTEEYKPYHCEKAKQPVTKPSEYRPTSSLGQCLFDGCNTIWISCNLIYVLLWYTLKCRHGGCWRPGAYLSPGRLQPSWWIKPVGASQESHLMELKNSDALQRSEWTIRMWQASALIAISIDFATSPQVGACAKEPVYPFFTFRVPQ